MIESMVTDPLLALRERFRQRGFDLRFVGGCVRDALQGAVANDIDLHTDAAPDEAKAIYEDASVAYYDTGSAHGTYTVIAGDVTYEITSLRRDVATDGRHAEVEFTTDWLDDLSRRDLTINAMSMTFEGSLFDPFGGEQDLRQGTVSFVGDADQRITEDYLRILRFFRFHGRYAGIDTFFDLDATVAIKKHREGLLSISAERIWSEMAKIVAQDSGPWLMESIFLMALPLRMPGHWHLRQFAKAHAHTRNPVTLTVALLEDRAPRAGHDLRWSGDEMRLARFLVKHIHTAPIEATYKRMIVLDRIDIDWVVELARLNGVPQIGERMRAVKLQQCPVTGEDLIQRGMKPGPELGQLLGMIRHAWAFSDYTATYEDLLLKSYEGYVL